MPPPDMTPEEQKGWDEALRRTDACRRTGGTDLYLSQLGLRALPPDVVHLKALTCLGLSHNQLRTLPSEIGQLTALTDLSLSFNELGSLPQEIGQLKALTSLDLYHNQLSTLPPQIGHLAALTSMGLGHNQVRTLPPEICHLTGLTDLDLLDNQLSALPPEIGNLTALAVLKLHGNQLCSLPSEIGHLKALTFLDLCKNRLSALPPEIGLLTALTYLDLRWNLISALPPEIGQLTALETMLLCYNQLSVLPPEIGHLTALIGLNLTGNELSRLPPEIFQITSLECLTLCGNPLTSVPPEISEFPALASLGLSRTQLSALPPAVFQIKALTSLHLGGNQQSALPPEIGQLTALTILGLDGSTLLTRLGLPESMLARLEKLYLADCPLTDVPRELCQRGWGANVAREVHAYVRGLREQGAGVINECKLILLGNGRAGKTSTARVLMGEAFDPAERSTHAIRLWPWERRIVFVPGGEAEAVRVNVWDFGGQDIYHQAHRLFLRTKAVFVVCWNAWEDTARLREDGDEPRGLAYWLEQILARHREPRILIIRTHADKDAAEMKARGLTAVPDWRAGVPDKFHTLPCLQLGCGAPEAGALEAITRHLDGALVAEMSLGSRAVPAGWAAVHARLRELSAGNELAFERGSRPPHAVLSAEEFARIVGDALPAAATARDPAEVRGFLHDIGTLYYDKRLSGRVVLDQRWAIGGIYAVLQRGPLLETLRRHGGMVSQSDLAAAWVALGYTAEEHAVLLDFMQATGQAVEIMKAVETVARDAVFMVPALLPKAAEPDDPSLYTGGTGTTIRGATLGPDVAQAIIVEAAKGFLRGGRYWRWGAELYTARTGLRMVLEWLPDAEWSYGGRLRVCVWGRDYETLEALRIIEEAVRQHWPEAGRQQLSSLKGDHMEPSGTTTAERDSAPPLSSLADNRKTAQGKRLTFSLAGADKANPDLEGAPEALYQALAAGAQQAGWTVFSYRHSTDQPDLSGLLKHVGTGDYVVVFLSRKYLRSRYCMEELRLVYHAVPQGMFPPDNVRIFGLGDWRPGLDEEWRALLGEWKKMLDDWRQSFALDVLPFVQDREQVGEAYKRVPAIGWFALCGDAGALQNFLSTLRSYVATEAPLPFQNGEIGSETWLAQWTAEIGTRLGL